MTRTPTVKCHRENNVGPHGLALIGLDRESCCDVDCFDKFQTLESRTYQYEIGRLGISLLQPFPLISVFEKENREN